MSDLDGFSDQEVLDLINLVDAVGLPLHDCDARDLSLAFEQVRLRNLHMDEATLVRWIGVIRQARHDQPGLDAIGAALCNDTPAVRERLRETLLSVPLDDGEPTGSILAAQALARLGDSGSADRIADLLPAQRDSLAFGHISVALEMLGEPSVALRLQDMLPKATDQQARWLMRAIARLTGHNPAPPDVDWDSDPDGFKTAVLRNWTRLDLTIPPRPRARWTVSSTTIADVTIDDGRGVFALEPDDPDWESAWPEWNYAWCHDHQRVYATGSVCGTCDILLERVGWAPDDAVRMSQAVRDQVTDVTSLDESLLAALEPILVGLASGHYQVRLVDIPLIPARWADTWFGDQDMRYMSVDVSQADREQLLYQLPHGDRPHPFVVAPTQTTDRTDQTTVVNYVRSIRSGQHPAAIVAAYSSERQAWNAEEACRSVSGFILDGHHKIAAYAEVGQPARVILICDREPRQPAHTNDPLEIINEFMDHL